MRVSKITYRKKDTFRNKNLLYKHRSEQGPFEISVCFRVGARVCLLSDAGWQIRISSTAKKLTLGLFNYIVTDLYFDLKEKSATSVFVIPTPVLVITTF